MHLLLCQLKSINDYVFFYYFFFVSGGCNFSKFLIHLSHALFYFLCIYKGRFLNPADAHPFVRISLRLCSGREFNVTIKRDNKNIEGSPTRGFLLLCILSLFYILFNLFSIQLLILYPC